MYSSNYGIHQTNLQNDIQLTAHGGTIKMGQLLWAFDGILYFDAQFGTTLTILRTES